MWNRKLDKGFSCWTYAPGLPPTGWASWGRHGYGGPGTSPEVPSTEVERSSATVLLHGSSCDGTVD